MRWLAYALGVLALLFIGSGVLIMWAESGSSADTREPESLCPPSEGLPGGFKGRGIALEFARSRCDVEVIIGNEQHENRVVMQRALDFDNFFILSYWLLFVSMGLLLTQRGSRVAAWVGALAILTGTLTAIFDLIENSRMRRVLTARLAETTDLMVFAIREATLLKWAFVFVTAALLAVTFFLVRSDGARARHWIALISGFSFAAAALLGFVALRYNRLIPLTVQLQLPGLIGLIILSFKWPEAFLEKL